MIRARRNWITAAALALAVISRREAVADDSLFNVGNEPTTVPTVAPVPPVKRIPASLPASPELPSTPPPATIAAPATAAAPPTGRTPSTQAEKSIAAVFGDEIKRVDATHDGKGAVALAQKMTTVGHNEEDMVVKALLARKAMELASRDASGIDAITDAANLLDVAEPGNKLAHDIAKIEALQTLAKRMPPGPLYTMVRERLITEAMTDFDEALNTGHIDEALKISKIAMIAASEAKSSQLEDVTRQSRELSFRIAATTRAKELKTKFDADPANAATAKKLALTYLVELDDPKRAVEPAKASGDAALAAAAPFFAADVKNIDPAQAEQLGDLYRDLAAGADIVVRARVLFHSAAAYESFLAHHEKEDLARAKVQSKADAVKLQLEKFSDPRNIDLLRQADAGSAQTATIARASGGVTIKPIAGSFAKLVLPFAPAKQDYEVDVTFVGGNALSEVAFLLPIEGKSVTVIASTHSVRIQGITTKALRGPLPETLPIADGKPHTFSATVAGKGENYEITATFDGKPMLQWSGSVAAYTTYSSWNPRPANAIGLGIYSGEALFSKATIRSKAAIPRISLAAATRSGN